ncbi:restriction endonuclease subunit S [Mastigocladus laminosus UU774]|nr:restriction endonuclease subunit S [Mastigocladus laminosus UU774]
MIQADTLKPGWTLVKFGDVVRLNKERAANPEAEGIERYVGLEHIDPDDLQIRRWGLVAEGTTFTSKFKPGQVLFGKRRAYQRKVAVADFEGVCSGDIYVLESANPSVLLPELLPFICQTDRFFEYAVGTSSGSLSPRTNWTSLAKFEFALPPLNEQERTVYVLDVFKKTLEAYHESYLAANKMFDSLLWKLMQHSYENVTSVQTGDLIHPHSWSVVCLGSIASVERGKFSHRPRNLPKFYGGHYPFVQTGDIASSRGFLREYSQTLSEEGRQYSRSFPKGSILITIAAVIGATAITTEEIWCTDSVVGITPKEGVNVQFLEYVLRYMRPYLDLKVATQTAQKNINLEVLRRLLVPSPTKNIQAIVTQTLENTESSIFKCKEQLVKCNATAVAFRNSILSGYQ